VKRASVLPFVIGLFIVATVACGTTSPTAMPDTQATVDAAIAATSAAQAGFQATVGAAVEATGVAAQATSVAVPSPTPSVEYVTMTEEELAALIDQAVADAAAATQECAAATAQATADDTITQEEVETAEVYATGAEEAIAYAEELIYVYYDLYGELAAETLMLLQAIEQDLAVMADDIAAVTAALQEIAMALEQGLALAEETIAQLEAAVQAASARAAEIQAQTQGWVQNLRTELQNRATTALVVQPNAVAADRREALLSAFDYVDAVRQSLADNRVSPTELADIAQLGANAAASLNTHGGPQLQRLSGSINDITGQIARGQVPQARANLGTLESALGARPPRP
jgi:hypothetical protein